MGAERLRRRALQAVGALLGSNEREFRAVEREAVDGELAARREPERIIQKVEADARAVYKRVSLAALGIAQRRGVPQEQLEAMQKLLLLR